VSGRWSMLASSGSILSDFTDSGQTQSKTQCRGGAEEDLESSVAAKCCNEWRLSECYRCLSACSRPASACKEFIRKSEWSLWVVTSQFC